MHKSSRPESTEARPERPSDAPVAPAPVREEVRETVAFERPRVRRLGALPVVTTAFGGSFNP